LRIYLKKAEINATKFNASFSKEDISGIIITEQENPQHPDKDCKLHISDTKMGRAPVFEEWISDVYVQDINKSLKFTMGSFGDIIGELNIKPIKLISPDCPEWFPMTTPGNEAKAK
jgi:hypothetical protein